MQRVNGGKKKAEGVREGLGGQGLSFICPKANTKGTGRLEPGEKGGVTTIPVESVAQALIQIYGPAGAAGNVPQVITPLGGEAREAMALVPLADGSVRGMKLTVVLAPLGRKGIVNKELVRRLSAGVFTGLDQELGGDSLGT